MTSAAGATKGYLYPKRYKIVFLYSKQNRIEAVTHLKSVTNFILIIPLMMKSLTWQCSLVFSSSLLGPKKCCSLKSSKVNKFFFTTLIKVDLFNNTANWRIKLSTIRFQKDFFDKIMITKLTTVCWYMTRCWRWISFACWKSMFKKFNGKPTHLVHCLY